MKAEGMASVERCELREHPDGGFVVAAVVRNATDRPLFVTCDVRRIHVDEAREAATVWFTDAGRDPDQTRSEPGRRHYAIPRIEAIEPGEERTVEGRLPEKLNRLVVEDEEHWDVETLDLSSLRAVDVRLNVADAPFYYNPKGGPLIEQLARWGGIVSTAARRPGGRPKGA